MRTIPEYWGEIKAAFDQGLSEWGVFAIVVLVGLISFGLGRLSTLQESKVPLGVEMSTQLREPQARYLGGEYVASKNGGSYYFPWCAGAERIAAGNRVWFASEKAARAAGYAPAKNCRGLGN